MIKRFTYNALGWQIHSELELPWLPEENERWSCRDRPEVVVARGDLPRGPDDLPSELPLVYRDQSVGFRVYGSGNEFFWFYEGVGTIRVQNGREIVVSPGDRQPSEPLHQLIIGPGFRTICFQQGRLVLHASTVVIGSTTIAFAGPSGRGKSTLAAACYARGHRVLTDDLTAVECRNGQSRVSPAYPALKVDPTIARELDLGSTGDDSWDSRKPVDVSDRFPAEPRPLDVVYLVTDGEQFAVEKLPAAERVFALLEASLALYRDSDREALSRHLNDCGSVATSVGLRRLVRPRTRSRLDDLGRFVEEDVRN